MSEKSWENQIPHPVELEDDDEYAQILVQMGREAKQWKKDNPQKNAQDFVEYVGLRSWMSHFADYWNIPEDEQITRRGMRHIDAFLTAIFDAV